MFLRICSPVILLTSLVLSACGLNPINSEYLEPTDQNVIRYNFTNALNATEGQMVIDKGGRVRVVNRVGTDPPVVGQADTQLTKDQGEAILLAFHDWKKLKHTYPASFGPIMSISYEGYTVEAAENESAPAPVMKAKHLLDAIATAALRDAPRPTVRTTTAPAAPVPLVTYILNSDIDYRYEYEADKTGPAVHRRITVSREEGLLKVSEKTTGPEPHDPAIDVKIHLTSNQLETLANTLQRMPEGEQRYPGIENGPYFSVKYDGRTIISGGLPDTPSSVKGVQLLLEGYAMDAKRFPEDE